ncbi:heat shock protein HslVU, ATPase subunit HslU [Saprolegnia diclina VS20]|uniref:Heat shock protein HslVU, ATPase subunit HslU n=1 Tax=Saprolegnia diclina (strain VS20) TaxID=1156394 RepID=T0PI15_SAPDV|nr:heat shock protein HslVU, ATPase subunit HslU [Saprolegnia diclina VS20]EQC24984.1 heat shock protein HslVU, ATPase subunit HslU [Saprolegnia diclina VS20]|eukprot:XP_008621589.1 heat shock protein HslVU, ATPase subunit HslU [Saprolegnia diclina VS20]
MFIQRTRFLGRAHAHQGTKAFSSFMLVDPKAASPDASNELTPEQVVYQLDQHIIGQTDAKKAVAIALRNRWRRRQLDGPMRSEISPMNILMSGPTGSGKTEIARRLARLTQSPFVKVEATKFTEVGVYGSNADSMIKDLTDIAIDMEREAAKKANASAARARAIERVLDLIAPAHSSSDALRRKLRADIASGDADDRHITVVLKPIESTHRRRGSPEDMMMELPPELQQMMKQLSGVLGARDGQPKKQGQTMTVKEALPKLEAEEAVSGLNEDDIVQRAIENVQTNGIVFLDEVDKLAQNNDNRSFRKGEGVQKELLALTEGCAVHTRHGIVHTDHILFIASGAFHNCSPSDLMPELQGRLPIRVNLSPLTEKDFVRILTETQYNLLDQVRALMATEDVSVVFTDDAIDEIASVSSQVNVQTDNIGARRLATVVAKITEHVSFHAPSLKASTITIDKAYVQEHLKDILQKTDLTKYIL